MFIVAGDDFIPVSTILTFPAGETSMSIIVNTVSDTIAEDDEGFEIRLSAPSNGLVLGVINQASIVILDDDSKKCDNVISYVMMIRSFRHEI